MSAIGMPGHLLAYFAPRKPLEVLPVQKKKAFPHYSGLADLLSNFENTTPPIPEAFEPPKLRKERLKKEKAAETARVLKTKIACYDPFHDPEKVKTADPKKTLFVGRLSYETTEKKLLKTFEAYGAVRDIRLVADTEGKPRGYAFIEFKTAEGLTGAYRNSKDKLIDGRRIVVDIERARTITAWLPRRLGGGEGPPRFGISKKALLLQRSLEPRRTMGMSSQNLPRRSGVSGDGARRGRPSNNWSGDRRPPRFDRDGMRTSYNERGNYDKPSFESSSRYDGGVKAATAGYEGIKSEYHKGSYEPKAYESGPKHYESKGYEGVAYDGARGYDSSKQYESGLKYESGSSNKYESGVRNYETKPTAIGYESGRYEKGYERGGYERGGHDRGYDQQGGARSGGYHNYSHGDRSGGYDRRGFGRSSRYGGESGTTPNRKI